MPYTFTCIATKAPGPHCIKLTINGKLDFNGNYHRILDADWLWCLVAMVVTTESKVTINGKFYATGPDHVHVYHYAVTVYMPSSWTALLYSVL